MWERADRVLPSVVCEWMSVQAGRRLVGLEKSVGARYDRIGTEGRAEQHAGLQCSPPGQSGGRDP